MLKRFLIYSGALLIFFVGITLILELGSHFHANATFSNLSQYSDNPSNSENSFYQKLQEPLSILLLQIITIIVASRLVGILTVRMGQPAVIGEMLAGIFLGPSLLGVLLPNVEAFLFPVTSMNTLRSLSQIGIILFMFSVGTKLDLQSLREQAHTAILVSHISILVPFFLGTAYSLLIYPLLVDSQISFNAFALFMGIAMSITAFPVLARIIEEHGLSNSPLGITVMTCAAVDDATAWCILAIVIALVRATGMGDALLTIFLTLSFVSVMIFLVRPIANYIIKIDPKNETRNKDIATLNVLVFILASSFITVIIGIHEMFGAFLAGVAMPTDKNLRLILKERVEAFSSVFLLPLFFVFTGLRTQVNLLNDWQSWFICAEIIVIAIIGKLGGSSVAARIAGMSWHDSLSIGILMNTRGLVELVVINIGYDLGILSPRVFTMMVFMAIVTTFMTGPLLSLLKFWERHCVSQKIFLK